MTSCRLCSDLFPQGSISAWNVPLLESPNFIVLPSLGALVEGWLLLVPKKHFVCVGALPDSLKVEMQEMKQFLCKALQQSYGQVCVFEHGPSSENLSVGCGVDHAHLHIVPVAFDLASAVTPFLPKDVRWSEAGLEQCRAAFEQGEDYLYLEQPIGSGRIVTHQQFGSQLFRRAVASCIGVVDQFNWRDYFQIANVMATINKVRALDGGLFPGMITPRAAA